jgi:hypothetical protein
MNFLKIWWHCHRNKGHHMTSYQMALGLREHYCETCHFGMNDYR